MFPGVNNQALYTAIQTTALEKSTQYNLPPFLTRASNIFNGVHALSWMIKDHLSIKKAQQAPAHQGNPAVYALFTQLISRLSPTHYLVTAALAAKCTEDLIEHRRKIYMTYKGWKRVVDHDFPVYNKNNVEEEERWFKLVHRTKNFAQEVFWLCMRLKDLELLFVRQDTLTEHRALREMIEDLQAYYEKISQDPGALSADLLAKKNLIQEIHGKLGMPGNQLMGQFNEQLAALSIQLANQTPQAVEAAQNFVAPLFVPGGVTPVELLVKTPDQMIKPVRYVPWLGQKIEIPPPPVVAEPSPVVAVPEQQIIKIEPQKISDETYKKAEEGLDKFADGVEKVAKFTQEVFSLFKGWGS